MHIFVLNSNTSSCALGVTLLYRFWVTEPKEYYHNTVLFQLIFTLCDVNRYYVGGYLSSILKHKNTAYDCSFLQLVFIEPNPAQYCPYFQHGSKYH